MTPIGLGRGRGEEGGGGRGREEGGEGEGRKEGLQELPQLMLVLTPSPWSTLRWPREQGSSGSHRTWEGRREGAPSRPQVPRPGAQHVDC